MKKEIKIVCGLVALLIVVSMSARPRNRQSAKPQTDSIKANTSQMPENSVIDEVIWVVGDEPIMKSDVEMTRLQSEAEGIKFKGNPDTRFLSILQCKNFSCIKQNSILLRFLRRK